MLQNDASQAQTASGAGPDARNDVDSLPNGSTGPAAGNVITAEGTMSAPASADMVANGPGTIVAINGQGGASAEVTPAAAGPMQVAGRYGTLTIDAQGNYSYERNAGTPDCAQDIFTYTLADAGAARDTATLTIVLGDQCGGQQTQTIATSQGVVVLPAGVELSDIRVVGRDLVITLPDGSTMTIPDGAVFVPQLVIGDVEVPPTNLAALLIDAEPRPASGTPDTLSSGGNFATDVPPLDPGVPLGDLLPPTELAFPQPVFEEVGQFIDEEPEITIQPDGQPASSAAVDQVDEEGLPARGLEPPGSNEASNLETTTGVINVDSPDGPSVVTITDALGVEHEIVDGLVVDGEHGTLTISIVNGEIRYSYTLGDNALHNGGDTDEDFLVTVTDRDGDTDSATLHIDIIDDQPIARNDVDSVTEDGPLVADGNIFTGSGGADANASDGVADTQGADGAHVQNFSFGAAAGTFGVPLPGLHGSLVLSAGGGYVYTLNNQDPAVQALGAGETLTEVYNYTIVDGDGSTSSATLTITINGANDAPTVSDAAVTVSEEGLAGGNPDTIGVPVDDTNSPTASGSVTIADVDGDAMTVTLGLPAGSFTSNGVPIVFTVSTDGHTLTGTAGTATVITVTINDSGVFNVVLSDQIDHPVGGLPGVEDEISLNIPVTANDGTVAGSGTITVTIEDDSPIVSDTPVIGTVDEDGVPNGIAGGPGDVTLPAPENVTTGNVSGMFSPGADQPLTFSLTLNGAADIFGQHLSSGGVEISALNLTNGVLTAFAGATAVFTLSVNATTGAYTFTLLAPLDHPTLDGQAGDNTENELTVLLGSLVQATDADGDSVTGSLDGLQIVVDDDTPTASGAQVTGTVDEDAVPSGIAGGPDDATLPPPENVSTGSVATLFNSGADVPLSFSLLTDTAGLPALTSGGVALVYSVVGNTLTATAGPAGPTVFTFALQSNGDWTFTLLDQLDHPTLNGQPGDNTENELAIDLSAIVQATDFDGDSVTAAANGLVITVDDDTPGQSGSSVQLFIDEDGLAGGNPGGPGDESLFDGAGPNSAFTVAFLFNSGADEPLTFSLNPDTTGLPVLTSGGVAITYAVNGNTLTASAGATPVFTLSLDPTTGQTSFTLLDQLDHPSLDGQAGDNTENNLILDLSSAFVATDADGDSLTLDAESYTVRVDDDTPVASGNQVTGIVDEDGLSGGNTAPATGDVAGEATVATGSVTTLFSAGADQPLTFSLSTNTGGLPALTSGGVALVYSVVGNTLTATAGPAGPTVFTFTLDGSNGDWTFTLSDQLDHPVEAPPGTENDITINLGSIVEATDFDGDTVTANANGLVITVDDDTPIANPDTDTVAGVGGTASGNVITDAAAGDSGDSDLGADSVGADQPGRVSFIDNSQDVAAGQSVPNGSFTDIAGQFGTLRIFSNGDYTYTRNDGLGGGQNEVFTYTLMDADGDTTTSTLTITIADVRPVATTAAAAVDDEGLAGGIAGGSGDLDANAGEATPSASEAVFNGILGGTAGDGTTNFIFANSLDGTTATVGTETVTYDVSGGAIPGGGTLLTATVTGGARDGTVLFTVQITNTTSGAFTLTLLDNVLHESLNGLAGDNTENDATLVIPYQMRDADGDLSLAPGQLTVTFDDDTPTAAVSSAGVSISHDESAGIQADADDVAGPLAQFSGVTNVGVDPDGAAGYAVGDGAVSSTGTLFGADGGTAVFSLNVSSAGVDSGLNTTEGQDIVLFKEGDLVVGRVGNSGGPAAFAIAIDSSTGQLSMVQYLSIQHPDAGDPDDSLSIANGAVLAVNTVTDADGDTSTASTPIGSLISFQDDAPIITAASNINIQNSGDVAHTGTFAFDLGADGAPTNNDVITEVTGSATVNGVAVSNYTISQTSENATTAVFTFSFDYNAGAGGTVHETGTLTFDKDAGTYTVDLANPIQGFSILATAGAPASAFNNYDLGTANESNSPTEVATVELAPNFFIQFSGVAEPGSGEGANNLRTIDFSSSTGTQAGSADTGVDASAWTAGELFNQTNATVTISSTAAGVAGNTIQGGEVLDFNLYQTDKFGVLNTTPTQSATEMFFVLDGIGGSEDMIVILKLLDTSTGTYTTRAVMVQNADIITSEAALAGTPYSSIDLDQNDGIVIIQANDYQQGNTNLVIVGAQIAGSDEGITGTAINLNGALGDGGASSGTQDFDTDVSNAPFKIQNIGFVTTSTQNQNAELTFDVTIQDGDGDTVSQTLTATVTSSPDSSTPISLDPSVTTIQSIEDSSSLSLLASDSGFGGTDQQLKSMNAANTNTVFLGAIAAAGLVAAPAAAHPVGSNVATLQIGDGYEFQSDLSAFSISTEDQSRSALSGESRLAIDANADLPAAASRGAEVAAEAKALVETQAEHQAPPTELLQATDTPAAEAVSDAVPVAHSVAMPSAEALALAQGNGGGDAAAVHTQEVGHVLADALAGGGNGPNLDALLDAVASHGQGDAQGAAAGAEAAANAAASDALAAVSAWDMGAFAGFTNSHAFSMESLIVHPDAAAMQAAS